MRPTESFFSEGGFQLRQSFEATPVGKSITKIITIRGEEFASEIPVRVRSSRDPEIAWTQAYLAGLPAETPPVRRTLRAVDLFCGSGGLTTGLKLAGKSLGLGIEIALACDADLEALEIYQANHGAWLTSGQPVERLVNYHIAARGGDATWSTWPTLIEPHMAGYLADLDVLIAGPPCQGHSNLNNRTRRNDNRNLLYLTTVAFAVATGAKLCIIENVPEVVSDMHDVVRTAIALLHKSGYKIGDGVLAADEFGVAQRRKRHFLVAVRNAPFEFQLNLLAEQLRTKKRMTLRQAISDLTRL